MSDYEALVQELAAMSPLDRSAEIESGAVLCLFCSFDYGAIDDPAGHELACLWRRAKALTEAAS